MEVEMNVDRAVMVFAGTVILASLMLTHYVNSYWLFLTTFVGLNLIQAAFSGFCPAAIIFKRAGLKAGSAFK
jgi:hypothetical protein